MISFFTCKSYRIDCVTKDHQVYYKCIQAKIPGGNVAVFNDTSKREKGKEKSDLEYVFDRHDKPGQDTAGYVQTMFGDSGGPYWTYERYI